MQVQRGVIVKGGDGAGLHWFRRAYIKILRKPLYGLDQLVGEDCPSDTPPGHAEIFREGINDNHTVAVEQRRRRSPFECEAVIDLVHDQAHAFAMAPFADGLYLFVRHHDTGRIGRAGNQHAVRKRLAGRFKRLEARHPTLGGARRHLHGCQSHGQHQVPVGRITRRRDRDPVAMIEGGKEGERETKR